MMLVYTWLVQHLTEEFVSVAFADGLLYQLLHIGMHDDGDAHFLGVEAIAHQAGIGGGLRRRGHGMLGMRVVECVGRRPTIGITAAASRRQGMQGRRFTDAELHVVGGSRGAHAAHIDGAFGSTQQHQLAKRDVVQAEVVTVATRVLVQDGDGGRGGGTAIPKLIELFPCVLLRRRREDFANLFAVDTELEQGHLAGTTADSTHPCREGIIGVGHHGDLLRPHIGAGGRRAIDNHEIARASVTQAMEVLMVQAGIIVHKISALIPKVGIVFVG